MTSEIGRPNINYLIPEIDIKIINQKIISRKWKLKVKIKILDHMSLLIKIILLKYSNTTISIEMYINFKRRITLHFLGCKITLHLEYKHQFKIQLEQNSIIFLIGHTIFLDLQYRPQSLKYNKSLWKLIISQFWANNHK